MKKFLKYLEEGKGIVSYACQKTGISRKTYYVWYNKNESFKQAVDDLNEGVIDIVESKLLNKINDEDITAIIFYLKTKAKHRGYVEKTEQDVSVNGFEQLLMSLDD